MQRHTHFAVCRKPSRARERILRQRGDGELTRCRSQTSPTFWWLHERAKPLEQEVDFEVNMMEPLEGWKSWFFDSHSLKSNSGNFIWRPLVAAEAKCRAHCKKIPAEHHTCGIYATEFRSTAAEYGSVLGRVYGWGRYIRGEDGWRTQFAYPKCFYLSSVQMGLVDALKQYQVPIYVYQPIRMYDPTEEGYINEHWKAQEDGSGGAAQEPNSAEDHGADYEED